MADGKKGWDVPKDMDQFIANRNRDVFAEAFPPDELWRSIRGVRLEHRLSGQGDLVSIQGTDQKGAPVAMWTDLPNAMYLLRMLDSIQRKTGLEPPKEQPSTCEPLG